MLSMSPILLRAQLISDEYCKKDTTYSALGGGGTTWMLAQSFKADGDTLVILGAWLERLIVPGQVRFALAPSAGGYPDTTALLYSGAVITPPQSGNWVYNNGLHIPLMRDSVYFFILSTQGILFNSGAALAGISYDSSDSGEPLLQVLNGSLNWDTLSGKYLAMDIQSRFCYVSPGLDSLSGSTCAGVPFLIQADAGFQHYAWSTGDTTASLLTAIGGPYDITVTDTAGCMGTQSFDLFINDRPFPALGPDSNYCMGDTVWISAPALGDLSLSWNPPFTGSTQGLVQSGTYSLIATDTTTGCQGGDTVSVVFHPAPSVSLPADTGFCEGGSLSLDAGPGFDVYLWQNGQSTRNLFVSETDTCQVRVTNSFGCSSLSDTCIVTVYALPAKPLLTLNGNTIVISGGNLVYSWYLNGQGIPGLSGAQYQPQQSGNYSAVGTDSLGCSAASDTLNVETGLHQSDFPGGISPNGDGLNDRFEILGLAFYPNGTLHIYNQWGAEVYAQSQYANTWDGKNNAGAELPDGSYYFLFEPGAGAQVFRGAVVINR